MLKKRISILAASLLLVSSFFVLTSTAADKTRNGQTKGSMNEKVLPKKGLNTWVPSGDFATSSLIKVPRYPDEILGNVDDRNIKLTTVRNEQASAQIAVASTEQIDSLQANVSDLENKNGNKISSENVQIRYVGYVPVEKSINGSSIEDVAGRAISGDKNLGVVADTLLEKSKVDVPDHSVQPIWFTFHIPKSANPGEYSGEITIETGDDKKITYNLQVTINDVAIPDPQDYEFNLDVWMNPNAIAAAYDVEPWKSEEHWDLIKKYFKDLASSGQDTITTTIIQNPWLVGWNDWKPQTATGYDTMVKWRYDGENWEFDYSIFDRYVQTGLEAGVGPHITAYSLLTFRGKQRITYLDERTGEVVTKRMEAGDPFWREAWTAFLNDFSDHLKRKGWLNQTYLAFDERPPEITSKAIDLLKDAAPEFLDQTQMAGTEKVGKYAQNLSLAIDSLGKVTDEWIKQRREAGKTTTYYVWAGDHHPNTLSFSPAVESRMMAWISADKKLDGFLRWAYNSWPKNVYDNPVYAFTQGDEYFVYPGKKGPMSSIRWELLKEGIEDYELVQMAREKNPDSEAIKKALELASRQWDGRKKDVHDIVRARKMIVENSVSMKAKGSFTAGAPTVVKTIFQNGFIETKNIELKLNVPEGWRVEPISQNTFEKLDSFEKATVSWRVTPSDGATGSSSLTVSAFADSKQVASFNQRVIVGGTYLSDLDWGKADNAWGPVEKDMSNGEKGANDGSALTINGQTFDKGLGVHAPSEIVYQLDGKYSQFTSYVGVDDEVAGGASIVFQVWGDGEKLYDSGLMTDSDDAKKVDISVDGIKELKLVVTDGGNGNGQDHGDWGNALLFTSGDTETSAADMKEIVEQYEEAGAFASDGAARTLKIHLTAVDHYAEDDAGEKVIKHMKGFKKLLNYQKEHEFIAADAYQTLKEDAGELIEKWQ
ncbi:hypothetical protein GCM10009001_04730 [Virgibacillus siamensis]|uniref:Glycosyl hydrolase family 98 putative carbohydrate-binding module domain-containing protein n=1 Tax=Virgibacillus siamensis TaxID=480071 RepID=A0ABN1FIP8_9BACI